MTEKGGAAYGQWHGVWGRRGGTETLKQTPPHEHLRAFFRPPPTVIIHCSLSLL